MLYPSSSTVFIVYRSIYIFYVLSSLSSGRYDICTLYTSHILYFTVSKKKGGFFKCMSFLLFDYSIVFIILKMFVASY